MKQKSVFPILVFTFCFLYSFASTEYVGDNLLHLLGTNTASKEFKPIKEYWLLDKNFENNYGGIKLSVNAFTDKVDAILIAGENFQASGTKFLKCTSPLPYNIFLSDDTTALKIKLGEAQKMMSRNTVKFYQEKIAIEVSFTNEKLNVINLIKFFKEVKPAAPPPKITLESARATAETNMQQKKKQIAKSVFNVEPIKEAKSIDPESSVFKKAILDVFKSYRESNFSSIKNGTKKTTNFWNYKFTYNTKLKIPGEKSNMLYSFPFIQSQLDFVSIIDEADHFDQSFVTSYKDIEKKLIDNFTVSEGWTSACIPNKESKSLSDLEFRNDLYGSIILDYSKSPKGKSVLYLRFLLYSN